MKKPSKLEALRQLGEAGIRMASRVSPAQALAEVENDDLVSLLCFLGEEDEEGFRSDDIWHFDTECIEGRGDYARLARRFRQLARGALPLERVRDSVGKRAWIEFEFHSRKERWTMEVEDDWVDESFLRRISALLDTERKEVRFTYHDLGGQSFLVGCATEEQRQMLNALGGLHFEWLSDAMVEESEEVVAGPALEPPPRGIVDPSTGAIDFSPSGLQLSRRLKRSSFLASPIGRTAEVSVKNEPWCSFVLRSIEGGETKWSITVFFNGEKLWRVQMTDSGGSGSRDNWDPKDARARQQRHDERLRDYFGIAPGEYKWGSIQSSYNERDVVSSIWIEYR